MIMDANDGYDDIRPDHAPGGMLESLRARGFLTPYEGPRYMPVYLLTDAGREALAEYKK